MTLEIKARFSRAHSLTASAEGSSAAAARSIRSGPESLVDFLGIKYRNSAARDDAGGITSYLRTR